MCLTIHSKVAKGSTRSSLNFYIRVLQEEENWFKGIAIDFSYIYVALVSAEVLWKRR